MSMDIPEMPVDLRLAAVVHLLSSSALRGATPNKTEALRAHLRGLAAQADLNPYLKSALQEVLQGWEAVDCHPTSTPVDFYPLVAPGAVTH